MLSTMLELLKGLPAELVVLIVAMLPTIELRGAIPVGVLLGLPLWEAFLLGIVGNLVPVPILLWVLPWMRKFAMDWPLVGPVLRWAEKRATKRQDQVEKAGFWGLAIFVGIPLPGTGAWTAVLIAVLLGIPWRRSVPAISLGVLLAGAIIGLLSAGGLMVLNG